PRHTRSLHSFPTRRSSDLWIISYSRADFFIGRTVQSSNCILGQSSGGILFGRPFDNDINPWTSRHQTSAPDDVRTFIWFFIIGEDRKSTRLNSSHQIISYA